MFPEDLSPLSSSTDDDQPHFTKFEHFTISTYSSSNLCDFTQESITRYHPNFTLAKIPFEQLCYFVRRYLKSVDQNPDKPEWPVNGMDKKQKRHFRRKVQDYKLKNNVLYHLHTYTEIVQGETIKRCTYFHFLYLFNLFTIFGFFPTSLYTSNVHKNRKNRKPFIFNIFQIPGSNSFVTNKCSCHAS